MRDTGDPDERSLDRETCQRMVETIDDSLVVSAVREADTGFNDVYFVTVENGEGTQEVVLKVSDDTAEQIRAEARLCRLLADATGVPVSAVLVHVDAHPDLPTPYFLMDRIAGEHPGQPPGEIPLADLQSLARQVGRYLGEVHAVDAFDAFGWIRAETDAGATGGARSLAREYGLTVAGAIDDWAAHLRDLSEMHLRHHPDTRFGDRTPELRSAIEDGIDSLDGSFTPVVGRVDHGFENLLLEPGTWTVTALLDWGMLRTVDPAYDLAWAEASFAGLVGLDAGRRLRVRRALLDGYETHASVDVTPRRRRLYHLINTVARQNWVSDWVPPESAAEIEREHRALLDDLLAE